jgi:IMP dehydrogenase/GMP reductase
MIPTITGPESTVTVRRAFGAMAARGGIPERPFYRGLIIV